MVNKRLYKPKPITTTEMEVAIAKMFGIRRHIIIPNISWGLDLHECDLLVLRSSGYAVEVEIKRSVADFKKDFEKKHAHVDRKNRIVEFYYAFPEDIYEKCKDLIPKDVGVIICTGKLNYKKSFVVKARIKKKSKRSTTARPMNDKEIQKATRLAALRIWTLKEKITRNERK